MLNLGIGLGLSGGAGGAGVVLGASEFYAPLTHSLILTRGTGDPTYSRATNAWEFGNDGYLKLVPSGAARFGGARMVRNFLPKSLSFDTAAWTKQDGNLTVTSTTELAPDGTNTAAEITFTGNGSLYATIAGVLPVGAIVRSSVYLKGTSGETIRFWPDIGQQSPDRQLVTLTGEWQRAESIMVVGVGAQNFAAVRKDGTTANQVLVWGAQLENVTGQADQTASEYVSAGVLSAPYHGAGTDGCKWFNTNKDGSAISASSLLGYHAEGARTNSLLYSRDLSNAAWVKTNITAAKTATGLDNAANSASTLTAGAANATILQTLSLAAAARSFSAYVKRRTGTGNVYITRDGGTNWTDITASLGASWTRVKIENTSVLNPSVGFKIATSGDAIDVDVCQDEAGTFASSPIITTTAAVTRNADAETFQTASNWSDTAGWALATVQGESWANATGTAIGNGTNGLKLSASNSGIVAYDGTNTVNGPAGSPSGAETLAMTWGSGALQAASGGVAGSAGSYDGAWGLATVGIGTGQGNVYIKDVYIGQSALTAAQLQQVTA